MKNTGALHFYIVKIYFLCMYILTEVTIIKKYVKKVNSLDSTEYVLVSIRIYFKKSIRHLLDPQFYFLKKKFFWMENI